MSLSDIFVPFSVSNPRSVEESQGEFRGEFGKNIYIYVYHFLNVELTFSSAVVTSSLLFLLILFVKLR